MLQNLDERRLCKNNFNVKVWAFRGSTINDMYDYLKPLLHVILHISTNHSVNSTSNKMLNDLVKLKQDIEGTIPGLTVILSLHIMRFDDNDLACLRHHHLISKLKELGIRSLDNSNIRRKHIGKLGLHLNNYGTVRYAMNLVAFIQQL